MITEVELMALPEQVQSHVRTAQKLFDGQYSIRLIKSVISGLIYIERKSIESGMVVYDIVHYSGCRLYDESFADHNLQELMHDDVFFEMINRFVKAEKIYRKSKRLC